MTTGYDLYLLDLPERLRPHLQKHREAWDRYESLRDLAHDDPDRRAAWDACEAMPDPRYFGLSISGIASVRAAMGAAGMLASDMLASGESQIEFPDWRHVPPEKLDGTPFHPDCYYPAEVCTPEQIAYMDALDGVRRYRPEGNSGIQTWKLRSNDYWIVNADECAEALQAWASVEPERRHAIIESVVAEDIAESGSGWIEAMGNICGSDGDDPRDVRLEPLVVTPCGRYPTVAAFVAVWFDWLAFLRLGAEGDGFMVE